MSRVGPKTDHWQGSLTGGPPIFSSRQGRFVNRPSEPIPPVLLENVIECQQYSESERG